MNTTENNKLIAEFLGAKQYDETDNFVYFDETNNIFSNDTISIKDLKFHYDWNWLMEVVDKIEEKADWSLELLTTDKKQYQVLIPLSNTNIITETKIEAVYNACV